MTTARVQEITTGAYDQDRLAAFYCSVFGMQVVWRRPPAPDGSLRGLFLSDGYMCLCIQHAGNGGGHVRPEGLQGIGMVVDDLRDVDRLAERYGALGRPTPRWHPDGEGYVDADVVDPIGILVNLTKRGFGVEPLEDPARMPPAVDPRTLPDLGTGLRSVTFEATDVGSVCSFYRHVFDLDTIDTQLGREERAPGCSLSDGRTALSCEPLAGGGDEHTTGRMARIGFVVESIQQTLQRAGAAGARECSPREGGTMRAVAYVVDPIGVRIDVSERV
jgi:catechol 2,3-dioxygenase-like lactoylglutathione lyase family enzyme